MRLGGLGASLLVQSTMPAAYAQLRAKLDAIKAEGAARRIKLVGRWQDLKGSEVRTWTRD